MKRDMDLIRLILLDVEGEEKPDLSGYTKEQVTFHKYLLVDAELAEGNVVTSRTPGHALLRTDIYRLTWAGHEFLDAARSKTTWQKAKALAKDKGVSLPVDLLAGLLKHLASQALGL